MASVAESKKSKKEKKEKEKEEKDPIPYPDARTFSLTTQNKMKLIKTTKCAFVVQAHALEVRHLCTLGGCQRPFCRSVGAAGAHEMGQGEEALCVQNLLSSGGANVRVVLASVVHLAVRHRWSHMVGICGHVGRG